MSGATSLNVLMDRSDHTPPKHTNLVCFYVNTNTNFAPAYQTQQKSSLKKIVIRHSRTAPSYLSMPLHVYLTLKRTGTKIVTPFSASCQLIHVDLAESRRPVLTSNIPGPLAAFLTFTNLKGGPTFSTEETFTGQLEGPPY